MNLNKYRGVSLGEPILLYKVGQKSISLSGTFSSFIQRNVSFLVSILLDNGSTKPMFVRRAWAQAKGLCFLPLSRPRPLYLADGCV